MYYSLYIISINESQSKIENVRENLVLPSPLFPSKDAEDEDRDDIEEQCDDKGSL
jgi:hypothetical protein